MLTEPQRVHLTNVTRTMQIVAGAIAAGLLFFSLIVLFLSSQRNVGPPATPLLTYVAMAVGLAAVLAWAVVPRAIAGRMREAIIQGHPTPPPMRVANAAELGDVLPLATVYQTRQIIGCALLEGAAFFCLVAYLIERQWLSLMASGALFVLLLGQIPTFSRVESWVESEMTTIDQLRHMH